MSQTEKQVNAEKQKVKDAEKKQSVVKESEEKSVKNEELLLENQAKEKEADSVKKEEKPEVKKAEPVKRPRVNELGYRPVRILTPRNISNQFLNLYKIIERLETEIAELKK
jgi:hypothetical protein